MTQPLQANLIGLAMAPAEAIVDPAMISAVEYITAKSIFDGCLYQDSVVYRSEEHTSELQSH